MARSSPRLLAQRGVGVGFPLARVRSCSRRIRGAAGEAAHRRRRYLRLGCASPRAVESTGIHGAKIAQYPAEPVECVRRSPSLLRIIHYLAPPVIYEDVRARITPEVFRHPNKDNFDTPSRTSPRRAGPRGGGGKGASGKCKRSTRPSKDSASPPYTITSFSMTPSRIGT